MDRNFESRLYSRANGVAWGLASLRRRLLAFALCCGLAASVQQALAQSPQFDTSMDRELPTEISPEGVRALADAGTPFILIDANQADAAGSRVSGPVRRIYYSRLPSFRGAALHVTRDRQATRRESETFYASQRLVGTPLEWRDQKLSFDRSPVPSAPVALKPSQLAEALKDGADIELVDLRAQPFSGEEGSIPGSRRLLPHQVDQEGHANLSKRRWLILIDGGDGVAWPIAERLHAKGYYLIAFIEGGYPAWRAFTER